MEMGMASTQSSAAQQNAAATCPVPQKANRGTGSSCGGACAKKQPS